MTIWRRMALGALLGAALVLFVHPVTRPSLIAAVAPRISLEDPTLSALRIPLEEQEPIHAAVFLEVALRKLEERSLLVSEAEDALLVVERAKAVQSNNSLWDLSRSALLQATGRASESRSAWRDAVGSTTYDDLQVERWIAWRRTLAQRQGASQAWHWAWIYWNRGDAVAKAIGQYGRSTLLSNQADEPNSLGSRTETLLNARKLRDGSRTVEAGWVGARLVEGATYPPGVTVGASTPRKLVTARVEMVEKLRSEGRPDTANLVEDILKDNEGWLALVESADHRAAARWLTLLAVAADTLPSGLLLASLSGVLFLACAKGVTWARPIPLGMRWPMALAMAALMGLVSYSLTRLILPAVAATASGLFLLYAPARQRSQEPSGLGALHEVVLFLLSLGFLTLLGLFLAGLSQPAQSLLPNLDVPSFLYGGSPLFAGLAWLVVSLLLLLVPLWAIAQRVSVGSSMRISLEVFGRSVLFGGIVVATVFGLLSAYLDHEAGRRLQRLVENEPANYTFNLPE